MSLASRRTIFFTTVLLATKLALGAECAPPASLQAKLHANPTVEDYATLGGYFGEKDDHPCAAQAWASALKLEPGSAKIAYMLGLNLYFAGQPEPAASALQQSVNLDPQPVQPHLLLATVLQQLHRNEAAAKEWHAALEIDPNSSMALDGVAKSLLASKDYAGVIRLLRSPSPDEDLALDLAIAYDHTSRVDEAVATLTHALEATPDSLPLADALAILYLKQERRQDAANLIEKHYKLHPDDPATQMAYFRIMVANEDRDKAVPLGKALLARQPHDFYVVYLNGLLEREGGDYAAARVHLEEAVELNPANADCRYNLGLSAARLHQPAEARLQLEKAIQLGWVGPEVHYELANAYRAIGESALAAQQLAIYQQASRDKQARTVAANKAGQADQEMRAGDLKSAIGHYREASEAVPKNPIFAYKLAMAMSASGDLAEAEQQFRKAVQIDPNYTAAWVGLGSTLLKQSKTAEAKDAIDSALKLDPGNSQALELAKQLKQ